MVLFESGLHIARLLRRDKRKEFAHNCAAYNPFGLDVFLSQKKINHVARFVELPTVRSSGKLPPILVVNVQVLLTTNTNSKGIDDSQVTCICHNEKSC